MDTTVYFMSWTSSLDYVIDFFKSSESLSRELGFTATEVTYLDVWGSKLSGFVFSRPPTSLTSQLHIHFEGKAVACDPTLLGAYCLKL